MCDLLGTAMTSLWGSREEKHNPLWLISATVMRGHPLLFSFHDRKSIKQSCSEDPGVYSLKINTMSLLNFDSLSCWVLIVLPSLEYDYIRPLILTGLHFLFRHTSGEEEMKWGNADPQEKTTPVAPFLICTHGSGLAPKQVYTIIYCSLLWIRIVIWRSLMTLDCFCKTKALHWIQVKRKCLVEPWHTVSLWKIKLRQLD